MSIRKHGSAEDTTLGIDSHPEQDIAKEGSAAVSAWQPGDEAALAAENDTADGGETP